MFSLNNLTNIYFFVKMITEKLCAFEGNSDAKEVDYAFIQFAYKKKG